MGHVEPKTSRYFKLEKLAENSVKKKMCEDDKEI